MLRRAVLVMVVLLGWGGVADAQRPLVDSASRWVDSILAPFASDRSPGCAVGVRENGALVFAKGYGMADLEHDTHITRETPFYIASLSKQFTAMSIVLLANDKRLSLDDSIQKWVPEVPSFGATITLRQLLNHTSGLRDYLTLLAVSGWPADGQLTENEFIQLISRQKSLNFAPGDEFLYSNTGYALLAVVVKRASGYSLRDFAAERIFKPLGMTHTEFRDNHTSLIRDRALGYQLENSEYRLSQPEFDVVGDGGVFSTIDDLAKWDANFETGRVGGKQGIALLQTAGRLNNGQSIHYGLGLSIGDFRGQTTFTHGGAYGGYRSAMLRIPNEKLTVFTLCNTSRAPATLADQVSRVFLGVADQPASVATTSAPPSLMSFGAGQVLEDSSGARQRDDQLAQLAGTYYSVELDLTVSITARDGVVLLSRPRTSPLRFVRLSDDLFMSSDQILLRIVRDREERVTGLALTVNRVRDLAFVRRPASP